MTKVAVGNEAGRGQGIPLPTRVRKFLGRIRGRFERDVFDVFVRPVPDKTPDKTPDEEDAEASAYEFRWGKLDDVLGCDNYHTELDELERKRGAERIAFGHRVVLGLAGGEVVFSMWVNPRNLNVPGLLKRGLRDRQWFIYKAYTSPDHRGRGLYKKGMQFVLEEMRRGGLRELVGYAHVKKKVSRKGLARLSFGSVGRVVQVRIPGFTRTSISGDLAAAFPMEIERSKVFEQ